MTLKSGKITLDIPSLLTSIGKSLYKSPTVALRELLQNAHDGIAVYLRRLSEPARRDFSPEIHITLRGRQLTVQDNGIGMSDRELEEELACIGRSGKEHLQAIVSSRNLGERIIGQYGIGFLASFLIADRVDVYSRVEREQAFHWWCEGKDEYFLEPCHVDFERGTRVVLTLKLENLPSEFQDISGVKDLVLKYGSLLPFPIFVQGTRVNRYSDGWASKDAFDRMSEQDLEDFLRAKFPVEFLDVFRVNKTAEHIRLGEVSFRAALFISKVGVEAILLRGTPLEKAATGVDVYCKGMYVQRSQELMPIWARFVHGVIDFDNLDLSLSREEIVENELFHAYRSILEMEVARRLRELRGTEKLAKIVGLHRPDLIQGMAIMGERPIGKDGSTLLNNLIDIVPFETTHGRMTLLEYQRAIQDASRRYRGCEANTIYTMPQRTTGAGESILASDMGWPVILTVPVEQKVLNDFAKGHSGIVIKEMSPDDLVRAAGSDHDLDDQDRQIIETLFYQSLRSVGNIQIRVSCFRESVPALLLVDVSDDEALKILKELEQASRDPEFKEDAVLQLIMRMAQQWRAERSSRYFYINARNELVKSMVEIYRVEPMADILSLAARTIYNSALLQSAHRTLSPRDAEIIVGNFNETLGAVLSLTLEQKRRISKSSLEGELPTGLEGRGQGPPFVFCAHSFNSPSVLAAIERVKLTLETEFGLEAKSASDDIRDLQVTENIRQLIRACQFGVADITGNNPNVMLEIGMLEMLGKPVVKIRDSNDETPLPVDIRGDIYCSYSVVKVGDRWDVDVGFVFALRRHLKIAYDASRRNIARI